MKTDMGWSHFRERIGNSMCIGPGVGERLVCSRYGSTGSERKNGVKYDNS